MFLFSINQISTITIIVFVLPFTSSKTSLATEQITKQLYKLIEHSHENHMILPLFIFGEQRKV